MNTNKIPQGNSLYLQNTLTLAEVNASYLGSNQKRPTSRRLANPGVRKYSITWAGGLQTYFVREKTMTKAELIEKLHKNFDGELTKRTIGELIDGVFENVSVSIKKEKRFSYPGFGTFVVRTRKARKGRNPQTGAEIKIKASKTVGFKPAPTLKNSL